MKKPILKDLFLEVTSRCNARCEHCGSSCGDKAISDEIGAEELKKVLYDVAQKYNIEMPMRNILGKNNNLLYCNENIRKIITWVKNNYFQYRNELINYTNAKNDFWRPRRKNR